VSAKKVQRPGNLRDFLETQLSKTALTEAGDFLAIGLAGSPINLTTLIIKLADCGFKVTDERIKKLAEEGRLIIEKGTNAKSDDRVNTWVRAREPQPA
jgi:hypothetical protein